MVRRGSLILTSCVWIAGTCTPAMASEHERAVKPAWLWSDEERFTARFAPGTAEARVSAAASMNVIPQQTGPKALAAGVAASGSGPIVTDVIDGSVHPELLMPIELFNDVVLMRYLPEGPPPRDDAIARWREVGMAEDPDALLRDVSRGMVSILRERSRRATREERSPAEAGDLRDGPRELYCRVAADAFETLRIKLGGGEYERFLRLLYEGFAPGRRMLVFESPLQTENALRSRVRGCR